MILFVDPNTEDHQRFVSRGGVKLAGALAHFGLDCVGLICADLGSHVGGFVDCLLQRGAARVYSVDTCYGTLAWTLRKDERVVVHERTNALHVELPEQVDLVTIDVAWTRQQVVLPHAQTLLKERGRIISLIKPQYEASDAQLNGGVVRGEHFDALVVRVCAAIEALGMEVVDRVESPITGHKGNREVFVLLQQS